ncbi:fungal-specific transcription factor domain-containing protein, partial [Colletotrichum cereale]
ACIPCRERKIKCDNTTPCCSKCRDKHRDCHYQTGEDKRKLSLRVAIELLSSRVSQLSQFIDENGLQPPQMPGEQAKALTRILNTLGLSTAQAALEQNKALPVDPALSLETPATASPPPAYDHLPAELCLPCSIGAFSPARHRDAQVPQAQRPVANDTAQTIADWEWSPAEHDDHCTSGVSVGSVRYPSHPRLSACSERTSLSDNDDDDAASGSTEEDLVNQISDRLGSLRVGPNGQISYHGPTSNFSLVDLPVGSDALFIDRTVRHDGQELLDNMGLGMPVPLDLGEHLIGLYFAWQDPLSHIVDRSVYEESKYDWFGREEETPYYSEALRNAMCSLGAAFESRYHPSFVTFPKTLPESFAARAKALLEIELDSPSVSTVQAMVVVSSHEIGSNRESRGWLYSGMAIRLAFDLALHKDMTAYVTKGLMTTAEAELRRAVFWGAYTVDQALGFHRGRPFRISMNDITVQKPKKDSSKRRVTQWAPYPSVRNNSSFSEPLDDHPEDFSLCKINLCEIVAPLGHTLYGNSKIPRNVLQTYNERLASRLFDWKESLPDTLQVDPEDTRGAYLPHVLLLHMQYYQNVIHCHRPWMSSNSIQPQPPQGLGYVHAQRMCIESAMAMAKLVQNYERLHTLRRVNIQGVAMIFSAAIILIFASMSRRRRKKTAQTTTRLSVCFRALEELSSSWECAKRARDFLSILQRK